MSPVGKYLIILGAIILITGILITVFPKALPFGKLPGDIQIKKENFTFYFPLATSILISIIISLILWIINFFIRR